MRKELLASGEKSAETCHIDVLDIILFILVSIFIPKILINKENYIISVNIIQNNKIIFRYLNFEICIQNTSHDIFYMDIINFELSIYILFFKKIFRYNFIKIL